VKELATAYSRWCKKRNFRGIAAMKAVDFLQRNFPSSVKCARISPQNQARLSISFELALLALAFKVLPDLSATFTVMLALIFHWVATRWLRLHSAGYPGNGSHYSNVKFEEQYLSSSVTNTWFSTGSAILIFLVSASSILGNINA